MAMAGTEFGYSPWLCAVCEVEKEGGPINVTLEAEGTITGARPPSNKRKKVVQKRERKIAGIIGGRTQVASGAMPWAKGDIRKKGKYRIEHKSCENKSFSLTRDLLDKITSEASYGEMPMMVIEFLNKQTLKVEDSWVVMPGHVLQELNDETDDD